MSEACGVLNLHVPCGEHIVLRASHPVRRNCSERRRPGGLSSTDAPSWVLPPAFHRYATRKAAIECRPKTRGDRRLWPRNGRQLLGLCGPWTSVQTRSAMRRIPDAGWEIRAERQVSTFTRAGSDPEPSLAKIGSGHSPRMLKSKKRPFAAQNPYFRLGVGSAALPAIRAWPSIGTSQPGAVIRLTASSGARYTIFLANSLTTSLVYQVSWPTASEISRVPAGVSKATCAVILNCPDTLLTGCLVRYSSKIASWDNRPA